MMGSAIIQKYILHIYTQYNLFLAPGKLYIMNTYLATNFCLVLMTYTQHLVGNNSTLSWCSYLALYTWLVLIPCTPHLLGTLILHSTLAWYSYLSLTL